MSCVRGKQQEQESVCLQRPGSELPMPFTQAIAPWHKRVCCHNMSHWRRADPFSDAEILNLRLQGRLFQCFRLTPSQTLCQGAFQKLHGLICPGLTRANAPRCCCRGPEHTRQVNLGLGLWGRSVQIPRCHMPCFQNVCPEVRC